MNNDAQTESPVYMGHPSDDEDSIDLLAVFRTLWRGKLLIALVIFLIVGPSLAYAFLAKPVYRAEAVLIPNEQENAQNLPASMTGLAGLAGINIGSSVSTTQVIATLSSRVFVEEFIAAENLLPILFADDWDAANKRWISDDLEDRPDIRDGIKLFVEEVRFIEENTTTGLVTVAVEWTDAELVAEWTEKLITRVNERVRDRDLADSKLRLEYLNKELQSSNQVELRLAISRLIEGEIQTITLAQAETEYAFKTIDPPRVPIEPVAPQKILIAALSLIAGLFFGVLAVLIRAAARRAPATNA
jgi:uncharacterized protein involved in exopolysaccharide biosynthesis